MSKENSIKDLSEPEKAEYLDKFIYEHLKFHAQLCWA